jgi:hypothetical protein
MNSCEQTAQDWLAHRGFGGLDWASQKHNVVVVDPRGKVVENFEIAHWQINGFLVDSRIERLLDSHSSVESDCL